MNPKSPGAERILHAAKILFAVSGFENTSTISIARQSQTSESQIIKHFGTTEGLLEAIFRRRLDPHRSSLWRAGIHPVAKLETARPGGVDSDEAGRRSAADAIVPA